MRGGNLISPCPPHQDGKRSAQFEHTLLITETGVDILTARTADSPATSVWFESVDGKVDINGIENVSMATSITPK